MIRPIINGANCKPYVRKCIESLKRQSAPFRAIVVDDGSTDGTQQEIINHLDGRFEVILKEKNEGPAAARFKALEALRAHPDDLIVLVDLDDRLQSIDALRIANNAKADVTYGSTITKSGKLLTGAYPDEVIKNKSYRETKWKCFPLRTFRYGIYKACNFTADDFKYHDDVVIDGKVWARKGDWYKVCTDVSLMHPIMGKAEKVVHLSQPLYYYNDIGNHIGRAKYPIKLWELTNKQINESDRVKNR